MCFKKIIMALAVALSCACTVLENRSACPCQLVLNLDDPANYKCDSLLLRVSTQGYEWTKIVGREQYAIPVAVAVPVRGGVYVSVVDNVLSRYCNFDGLSIPLGEQCPQAYMFGTWCDTTPDEARVDVRIHKNYCGVTVCFSTPAIKDYDLMIRGGVSGYSREGVPMPGEFGFVPYFEKDLNSYFRLPRQTDASLRLEITTPHGNDSALALGSYIVQSGYDWSAEDLDDIVVYVDFVETTFTISINEWSEEVSTDIII